MANWTSKLTYEAIVDVSFFFQEMSITDDASSGRTLLSTSSEMDYSGNELTVRSHAFGEDIYQRSNLFPQFAPSMPTPTDDHCYSSLGFYARGNKIQNDFPNDVAFVNSVNVVRSPVKKQPLDSKPQRSRSGKTRRKHVHSMKQYDMELLNSMQQVSAEPVANSKSDVEKKHLLPFDRSTGKDNVSKTNSLVGYTKRREVRPGRKATGRDATVGRRRDREREVKRYKKLVGDAKEQEVRQCKKSPRWVPTTRIPRSQRRNMATFLSSAIAAPNQGSRPLSVTQDCLFPSFNLGRDQPKRRIEKSLSRLVKSTWQDVPDSSEFLPSFFGTPVIVAKRGVLEG
jgi:hypothetical protein